MPLPWEKPLPWETTSNVAASGQGGAATDDTGYPFGNPVDGRRVLTYLMEPMPVSPGAGMLAAFTGSGAPKTRRQVVVESLEAGLAMAGAAAKVKLSPVELEAAVAASAGLARDVEIAMNEGDVANTGDSSGLSRWRFARTGNADKPEDGGDASADLLELQSRLRSILDANEPAPGWEPMFGATGAG